MRGGRIVAATGTLALLGALAVPVLAATPTLSWTITGSRTGYADVTLAAPATFAAGSFSVATEGGYAGFALWRAGTVVVGGVRATGWPSALHIARDDARDVVLAPGRYRLYLLADRRSSVTVRLRGSGAGRRVTVRTPVAAAGAVLDLGEPVTATKRVRLPDGRRTFALLAISYYTEAAVAVRAATCFRPAASDDCALGDYTTGGVNGTSTIGSRAIAWPGELSRDGAYGVFRADGVAVGARVVGYYLAFDAG